MGAKVGIAILLGNLGGIAQAQGDYSTAQSLYEESLALTRELGDKRRIAESLNNLAFLMQVQGNYAEAREIFGESLTLSKKMELKTNMANALLGLGLVDLAENNPNAHENILHSLYLRWETGEKGYQTSSLIGAARLVLQEGNPQFAAQLLGAVESALKGLNVVVDIDIRFFHEQTLAKVKDALGEEGFQSAWEEGSQWSLEETVMKVLGER